MTFSNSFEQRGGDLGGFREMLVDTWCVNMVYDAGPITQAERMAVGNFIDAVGSVELAKEVLRHMPDSSK